MTNAERQEAAQYLRAQAQHIRSHGLTNFFEHTYTCLRYGQLTKAHEEERCLNCLLRSYVPPEYENGAFPCQHITEEGWRLAAQEPGLAERVAARLLRAAEELEEAMEMPGSA